MLPAILAYICTPATGLARQAHALAALAVCGRFFLAILGAGRLFAVFAASASPSRRKAWPEICRSCCRTFVGQATDNHPVQLLGHAVNAQQIVQSTLDRMRDWIGQTDQLALLTGYSLAAVMGAFLSVVLLFYFLATGQRIASGLLWIAPPHRRPLVRRIWARLDPVLTRYFLGMIVVVIYATTASYVGLGFFLGIHHAILLALLTGILETVPVIGPTSAAIIAGLVSLRTATGIHEHCGLCALCHRAAAFHRPVRRPDRARHRRACASGADHLLLSCRRHRVRHSGHYSRRSGGIADQEHLGTLYGDESA